MYTNSESYEYITRVHYHILTGCSNMCMAMLRCHMLCALFGQIYRIRIRAANRLELFIGVMLRVRYNFWCRAEFRIWLVQGSRGIQNC